MSLNGFSTLIGQVRYFEELLKESEPIGKPVGGLLEVMVKNFSISVWEDEDIQRTLSFVEKVNLLSLKSSNLGRMIRKW